MSAEKSAGAFDALLEEINGTLTKALPADGEDTSKDDEKIADAAGEGDEKEDGDGDADDAMAKSFEIELADGTKISAVDGVELVKSLIGRIETNEGKLLGALGEASKVIAAQGDMLKSLRADVAALKDQGKPRKAVLTVSEKPVPKAEELKKSDEPQGLDGEAFMAKALAAQAAGRLAGVDVATAEACINANKQPPAHIVRVVLGDA